MSWERFEDYTGTRDLPGHWDYVEATDTKAIIAFQWHEELEADEDGYHRYIEIEASRILDNGTWRELTVEEADEHFDDLRDWCRR